jgi:multimeric flavodoxin WrbA
MHVLIINGSPRVKKFSNTDKILDKFEAGMAENAATFTRYEVSDKNQWDDMRSAFNENKHILIAIPLYVECIPGLLIEFLETLTPKNDGTEMAFILQGGFAEGVQLRCGEAYLKILTEKLGCKYCGTLVKGDNFGIRFMDEKNVERITGAYTEMGREYAKDGNFFSEECAKFTGPEIFPVHIRLLIGIIFKTLAKNGFKKAAKAWGCTKPLNYRPYK